MKITALLPISLLALTAGAQERINRCQTVNGSPQAGDAQRAINSLNEVSKETLCAAGNGGFALMREADSARLTIRSNVPGGAGLFCSRAVGYLQSLLNECRISNLAQGSVDVDQKDIIFLTNRGADNEDGRIAAVSKEGISVKGVSIGPEGFIVEGNRGYVRLSIERQ